MASGSIQHYLVGLLAVANNFSAIGPFLSTVAGLTKREVRGFIAFSSLASFVIMVTFMVLGTAVLGFFGISISDFQIAGGVLLAGIGLNMMNSSNVQDVKEKQVDHSPSDRNQLISTAIVPIAMPLTSGAGTISTVTLFAAHASRNGTNSALFLAIICVVILNTLVFAFSISIIKFIGPVGLTVFTKIMGLFTLAIGVEFIVNGVTTILRTLPSLPISPT